MPLMIYAGVMYLLTAIGALGCLILAGTTRRGWREDALNYFVGFTLGTAACSVVMTYAAVVG